MSQVCSKPFLHVIELDGVQVKEETSLAWIEDQWKDNFVYVDYLR